MTITPAKWTILDYHRMIEAGILDDRQVELLHGEIIEMTPEGMPHANRSTKAANYLRQLLGDRVEIREGKPITLASQSEPQPDIAIVQPLDEDYQEHHPYSENIFWLIEISNSTLAYDLQVKSRTYAWANIQEYWVVNLRDLKLVVFRNPGQGRYGFEIELTEGEIQPIAFPDVAVSVGRILGR